MSDDLLLYYNRELSHIRRQGAEFARAHPDVAARLRLDAETCDDPHVERMLEAFAYLTARIRRKIDDDFPQITDALMSVLYPHYQAPVPSMSIAQFTLDPGHGGRHVIKRGTVVETDPVDGLPCRFRTGADATLWPIDVAKATLGPVEMELPNFAVPSGSASMIRLQLQCAAKDVTFEKLGIPQLRFFLNGQRQHVFELYELIMNHCVGVAVRDNAPRAATRLLKGDSLSPGGFSRDEALLPQSNRTFPGYRLLSEYFAFPEKFLFVDLGPITPQHLQGVGNSMELLIFLDRASANLEHNLSRSTFALGCAPMINLFQQRADPIELTQAELSYRVVPDARHPRGLEVYSIDRVFASTHGESRDYLPFFAIKHGSDQHEDRRYWYATRMGSDERLSRGDEGTEVELSFVDLDFNPSLPADSIVTVETTCLSRDLPARLPFGGGQPRLSLPEGGPLARIECLTAPTKTHRPPLREGAMWRIISHLSLNHLSISGGEDGADAMREILSLYDFVNSAETRMKIAGLVDVQGRRRTFRAGSDMPGAVLRGVEVEMLLDEEKFSDHGLFLFASVLEQFMGLYCSVNSATQTVLKTRKRDEEVQRWPVRAGERVLL